MRYHLQNQVNLSYLKQYDIRSTKRGKDMWISFYFIKRILMTLVTPITD